MIKYLGSKRTLASVLGTVAESVEAQTAVDLFTGTTRVAQEFKRRGLVVTAADIATYSEVLAQCYIATDSTQVDKDALHEAIAELNGLPGKAGYFTETFCEQSRFFQPKNGARVDAIREKLAADYSHSPLLPLLLTALMLAADRVDSTTGLQMAYLKQWAARSYKDLELRLPELLVGPGKAVRGDASEVARTLPRVDLAYLDPPYNQHRYFTNYHIWETLVRWDKPAHYGVACKRIDARADHTKSVFNKKRQMPNAFMEVIAAVKADVVMVSYNNESWVQPETIETALREAGHEEVSVLAFDYKRYVGAQIGVFSPAGTRVGEVSHLRNLEYVLIAGERSRVAAAVGATNANRQA